MADEGFKRKLTAIFSADAVGYSRLMAGDEAATVKTIATYRQEICNRNFVKFGVNFRAYHKYGRIPDILNLSTT
jgi:class 3 adenylate cyclase